MMCFLFENLKYFFNVFKICFKNNFYLSVLFLIIFYIYIIVFKNISQKISETTKTCSWNISLFPSWKICFFFCFQKQKIIFCFLVDKCVF